MKPKINLNKPDKNLFPKGESVILGKCPDCNEFIKDKDFKDDDSLRMFSINGRCLKCQKKKKE